MDRSYYVDVCFANVQRQLSYFSERDYTTYLSHHTDMKVNLEPLAVALFLCVDTGVCKERTNRRLSEKEGRKCESGITIDYLDRLDSEIRTLADSLKGKTIVKDLPWTSEKSDDENVKFG